MTQTNRQQAGFTLMEAMVALLIFSVGLLGLASMQMSGLQNNHKALLRTQAIQQTYEMVEHIRSTNTDPAGTADMTEWVTKLALHLPNGQGQVNDIGPRDPITGLPKAFVVSIHWDENRTGVTGLNCPPQGTNDLRCFRMIIVP